MIMSWLLVIASGSQLEPAPSIHGNYLCNYARVRNDGPTKIRAGYSRNARVTAVLAKGTRVYVCDEARDASDQWWLEVFFRKPGRPCAGGTDQGLRVRLSGRCASGWVKQDAVEVISG